MYNWNAENMELMNNQHTVKELNRYERWEEHCVYDIEDVLTRDEKIELINRRTDGKYEYICILFDKFQAERDGLKKDKKGCINTNSLKAWARKNDAKRVINTDYSYGRMWLRNCECNIQFDSEDKRNPHNWVDKLCHDVLATMEHEEREYFADHDPYTLKFREWEDLGRKTFGKRISWGTSGIAIVNPNYNGWDNSRRLTLEELTTLVEYSKRLRDYEEKLSNELVLEF